MPVTISGNGSITGVVVTTADIADSSITTNKIANDAVVTADIANGAVTLPKMANIATGTVLGRTTAGTGVPEAMTGAQARTVIGADNASNLTSGTVALARGGTGASSAATARSNLGADNASNLTSGTVSTDRLGSSGTRDATTFLRGDNSWNQVSINSLSGVSLSSVSVGQSFGYGPTTVPQGTFLCSGEWSKNSPIVTIFSPSAELAQRLSILPSGTTISIYLPNVFESATVTTTGTVTVVGTTYTIPVNITSFTGVTEPVSEITTFAFAGPNAWTNVGYITRAWVNFNGSGTVAIRGSGNVTSITDNGVGTYTVNFTTAMSDNTYATTGQAQGGVVLFQGTFSASSCRITTNNFGGTTIDPLNVSFAVFR